MAIKCLKGGVKKAMEVSFLGRKYQTAFHGVQRGLEIFLEINPKPSFSWQCKYKGHRADYSVKDKQSEMQYKHSKIMCVAAI